MRTHKIENGKVKTNKTDQKEECNCITAIIVDWNIEIIWTIINVKINTEVGRVKWLMKTIANGKVYTMSNEYIKLFIRIVYEISTQIFLSIYASKYNYTFLIKINNFCNLLFNVNYIFFLGFICKIFLNTELLIIVYKYQRDKKIKYILYKCIFNCISLVISKLRQLHTII